MVSALQKCFAFEAFGLFIATFAIVPLGVRQNLSLLRYANPQLLLKIVTTTAVDWSPAAEIDTI